MTAHARHHGTSSMMSPPHSSRIKKEKIAHSSIDSPVDAADLFYSMMTGEPIDVVSPCKNEGGNDLVYPYLADLGLDDEEEGSDKYPNDAAAGQGNQVASIQDDISALTEMNSSFNFLDINLDTEASSRWRSSCAKRKKKSAKRDEIPRQPHKHLHNSLNDSQAFLEEVVIPPVSGRTAGTSSTSSSSTSRKDDCDKQPSKVSFGEVQVRKYDRILDINPAVTNGAAIGLGWRYTYAKPTSVDEFERQKYFMRSGNDLILPRDVRDKILRDLGYTSKDIAEATRVIIRLKNRRRTTLNNLQVQPFEEAVESAKRRLWKLIEVKK